MQYLAEFSASSLFQVEAKMLSVTLVTVKKLLSSLLFTYLHTYLLITNIIVNKYLKKVRKIVTIITPGAVSKEVSK